MTNNQNNRWLASVASDAEAVFEDGEAGRVLASFGSPEAEMKAALEGAFVKDIAGAGVVRTSGEAGLKLLRRLLASDAAKFASGDAFRSAMLNASGGVMLEVRALCRGNAWELVLAPSGADSGLAWMRQVAIAFDAEVEDVPAGHAFWLGGPQAPEVLAKAGAAVPKAGRFAELKQEEGAFLTVSAFPGNLFLVSGDAASADAFWQKLVAAGAAKAGEAAWETVRAANCLAAPGAEYDESSSPLECGFENCVDFSDPSRMFIGRALTEARWRAGVRCRLGTLEIDSAVAAGELEDAPEVAIEGNSAEGALVTSWVKAGERVLALALLPASAKAGTAAAVALKANGTESQAQARVLRFPD